MSFIPDGEKDEKREAYRAERNRRFIQNSPMTVSSVLQGHILWWQMYGRMYGPDKFSVLAAHEVTSRMTGPEMTGPE